MPYKAAKMTLIGMPFKRRIPWQGKKLEIFSRYFQSAFYWTIYNPSIFLPNI